MNWSVIKTRSNVRMILLSSLTDDFNHELFSCQSSASCSCHSGSDLLWNQSHLNTCPVPTVALSPHLSWAQSPVTSGPEPGLRTVPGDPLLVTNTWATHLRTEAPWAVCVARRAARAGGKWLADSEPLPVRNSRSFCQKNPESTRALRRAADRRTRGDPGAVTCPHTAATC